MDASLNSPRKVVISKEILLGKAGPPAPRVVTRVASATVITDPDAGRYIHDLAELIGADRELERGPARKRVDARVDRDFVSAARMPVSGSAQGETNLYCPPATTFPATASTLDARVDDQARLVFVYGVPTKQECRPR